MPLCTVYVFLQPCGLLKPRCNLMPPLCLDHALRLALYVAWSACSRFLIRGTVNDISACALALEPPVSSTLGELLWKYIVGVSLRLCQVAHTTDFVACSFLHGRVAFKPADIRPPEESPGPLSNPTGTRNELRPRSCVPSESLL